MNLITLNYALDDYNLNKALRWGNCKDHFYEGIRSTCSKNRIIHFTVTAIELIPIIGQIASIFEYKIVQYVRYAKAVTIQKYFKSHQAQQKLNQLQKEYKDCIIIQSMFRSYLAQQQFLPLHEKYLNNLALEKIREQIPPDCYDLIFMRLDFKSALSAACVDKKWTNLVKSSFECFLKIKYPHSPLTNLNPIKAYCTHVNQQRGQIVKEITLLHPCGVRSLAFSKKIADRLITGSDTIYFWQKGVIIDKADVKGIGTKGHATFSSDESRVFFSDDNRWFLYQRDCKTLKSWNVHAAIPSHNGTFLVKYGTSRLSIIDTNSSKVVKEFYSKKEIFALAFSPNDKILAIAFENGLYEIGEEDILFDDSDEEELYLTNPLASGIGVCLWNLDSNAPNLIFKNQAACITDLTFSPDGKILAMISADKKLRLWQWESTIKKEETEPSKADSYLSEFEIQGSHEYKVKFSPDGNFLSLISFIWYEWSPAILFKRNQNLELSAIDLKDKLKYGRLKFSPQSDYFINYSSSTIDLWDLKEIKCIKTLYKSTGYFKIEDVDFSRDGTQIAIALYQRRAPWDTSGEVVLLDFKPS